MVNSTGGIVRGLVPLVSVLPAASVNLTSSRLRRLVLRGYLGFRVSDVGGNFLGFSRANAERMWKYIRQFQFRRMHTDAYKALAKLCSAAEVSQTPGAKTCLLL